MSSAAVVRTLSVRSRDRADGRVRLGVERALEACAPSLPRAAILLIRRVPDPIPGIFAVRAADGAPAQEWQRALTACLDDLARQAARPARGPVPAAARAVLFSDRAELLASLAADWVSGAVQTRWWWRALLRGRDARTVLLREWIDGAAHAPAALDLLATQGRAVAFTRALPPADSRRLAAAVAVAHGIAALDPVRPAVVHGLPAVLSGPASLAAPADPPPRATRPAPRWAAAADLAGTTSLHRDQRLLLIVGLALRRARTAVRASTFWTEAVHWSATATPDAPSPAPPRPPTAASRTGRKRPAPRLHGAPSKEVRPDSSPSPPELPGADGALPSADTAADRASSAGESFPAGARSSARPAPSAAGIAGGPDSRAPNERGRLAPGDPAPPREAHPPGPLAPRRYRWDGTTASPPGTGTPPGGGDDITAIRPAPAPSPATRGPADDLLWETRFGGVFFLLNLAQYLELYGDFTTPLSRGIDLDPWDFLELLGRELLGGRAREDAIWDLLSTLAGRKPGDRPGRDFAPEEWRVPGAWLAPFERAGSWSWSWSGARGRLRVEHPAGFPVIDVPRNEEPARVQVDREIAGCGFTDVQPVRRGLRLLPPAPLRRWTAAMAAYTRARLALALGSPPPLAVSLLLERDATVSVRGLNVDVAMSLSALPIEIRVAGLDRDPGWIPAAGRIVAFHFE